MDNDYISLCITLKNRADFLDQKLHQLQFQNYDLKKVEICITDGYSTDNLMEVIEKLYKYFYQIKYAISDRSVLPFKISNNQPTCDYNSQMANQPTFEKIIRTDAEVLFTHENQLRFISDTLNDKDVCLYHHAYGISTPNTVTYDYSPNLNLTNCDRFKYNGTSAFCICINKSTFIENGGFEEKFVLGFAAEDSHMIEWYRTNKKVAVSPYYVVHMYHPSPWNRETEHLRQTYSLPLMNKMLKNNERPNSSNPLWVRKEMIKDEKIFRSEERY